MNIIKIEKIVEDYLEDYEYGDSGYYPTGREKLLIKDAFAGLMADPDFIAAIAPPAASRHLSNLLARIHRDGGHYEAEHGTEKAVADADLKIAALNAATDSAPAVGAEGAPRDDAVDKAWDRFQDALAAGQVDDMAALVRRLARALRKAAPEHDLPAKALDYLERKNLKGSVLRAAQPVAWEYQNEHGNKFLTTTDPSMWHPHDRVCFRNFRPLVYAPPAQQEAVAEPLRTALAELVALAEMGDADQDDQNWHPALENARAALSAAQPAQPVPEGWKLVPVEPNDKMMLMGGFSFAGRVPNDEVFPEVRKLWAQMLRNVPDTPSQPVQPIGYLPAQEVDRLRAGHDGYLRSAKFGPSQLDGDVAVFLAAESAQPDWRQAAAQWLRAKAAEQEATNAKYPDHVAAYPSWEKRVRDLTWLAEELEKKQCESTSTPKS